jgi:Papain family cysteine protease/Domain of unknown function (DUF4384)
MLRRKETFAMLSHRRAAGFLLGACCAAFLLRPALLLAQQFDPPDTEYSNGYIEDDAAFLQTLPMEPTHRAFLPISVDLSYRLPDPGSQGHAQSCTAWATAYAARSYYTSAYEARDTHDFSNIASPAFVYNLSWRHDNSSCDAGSHFSSAVEVLKRGAPSLAEYAYRDTDCSAPNPQTISSASDFRVKGLRRVDHTKLDDVKGALARSDPVLISFHDDKAWHRHRGNGVFDQAAIDEHTGWHAMAIVGYDERKQAFRLINSWGKGWGDHGYAWVSYDAFKARVREAEVLWVVPPNPRPVTPPPAPVGPPPKIVDVRPPLAPPPPPPLIPVGPPPNIVDVRPPPVPPPPPSPTPVGPPPKIVDVRPPPPPPPSPAPVGPPPNIVDVRPAPAPPPPPSPAPVGPPPKIVDVRPPPAPPPPPPPAPPPSPPPAFTDVPPRPPVVLVPGPRLTMSDLTGLTCGRVSARREGGSNILEGYVSSEKDFELVRRIAADVPETSIGDVILAPWPQCEAIQTLEQPLDAPDGPEIEIGPTDRFRAGDPLHVAIRSPKQISYLYVSYVQADGSVVHLVQPAGLVAQPTLPDQTLNFGDGRDGGAKFTVGRPFGREMIIAIASRSPLFDHALPARQTEREYLTMLRRALTYKPSPDMPDRELSASIRTLQTRER